MLAHHLTLIKKYKACSDTKTGLFKQNTSNIHSFNNVPQMLRM